MTRREKRETGFTWLYRILIAGAITFICKQSFNIYNAVLLYGQSIQAHEVRIVNAEHTLDRHNTMLTEHEIKIQNLQTTIK